LKVTILISTYNRPELVNRALRSIYAQEFEDFEVILTRDGGCPVVPIPDDRLIFIDRNQNLGLPYSFNRALEIAQGEYICYLGDDDLFYPHHISTLVHALDNTDMDVVYSDLYKVHYKMIDGQMEPMAKNVEISRDFDRMVMLQFNHVLHVSFMHRKSLLAKTGLYNEDITVLIDWDLTRRMCFFTDFLHVPKVTGEFWAEVGGGDRISTRERKNKQSYTRNLMTIKLTRPPKPWIIDDLAIVAPKQLWPRLNSVVAWPHLCMEKLEGESEWVAYVNGDVAFGEIEAAMNIGGGQLENGIVRSRKC
jgi:glycosyltransferase involved in cell wall biosynthesis